MKDIGFKGLTHHEFDTFTAMLSKSDSDMVFLPSGTFVFNYMLTKKGKEFTFPDINRNLKKLFKRRAIIVAPLWFCEVNSEIPNHTSVLVINNKRRCAFLIDYGYTGVKGVKKIFSFFEKLIPKRVDFILTNGFNKSFQGRKSGRW